MASYIARITGTDPTYRLARHFDRSLRRLEDIKGSGLYQFSGIAVANELGDRVFASGFRLVDEDSQMTPLTAEQACRVAKRMDEEVPW